MRIPFFKLHISKYLLGFAFLAGLWSAVPHTSQAQLLENRGKLRTMKGEKRGFLDLFRKNKIRTTEPAGTFSGKKGKIRYSPAPKPVKKSSSEFNEPSGVLDFSNEVPSPRFSPPNDKQFKGRKNRVKSKSGSMSWFGSTGNRNYFNPSISGFQGFERKPSKKGKTLYFKDLSRLQSKLIVKTRAIQKQWPEGGYQGFQKGRNRLGERMYYRDLSKKKSGLVIKTTRIAMVDDNHEFRGFEKGRNRRGQKMYYKDVSSDLSGLVIKIRKPGMVDDNHNFRGFEKGRSKWGEKWFNWENSWTQSRYEGSYKTTSYAEHMKDARKMGGKIADYTGGFKTPKRNNKMHPSASYVYGKRASTPKQKELIRKLNVVWVRLNGNKAQPDSVIKKPAKLKFDKKEKDLWNY